MIPGPPNSPYHRRLEAAAMSEFCTCGVEFDGPNHSARQKWHDIHAEAARRRGDDHFHMLEPF